MFDLTGKLALVTGSSRGIGKAIALDLARAGADVIVHGREETNLIAVAEEIDKIGARSDRIIADTSSVSQINDMFDYIESKYGHLDILVNNAAVLSRHSFLELPIEEWDRIMDTNCRGYFLCAQRAARMMVKRKKGRIINISSISQYTAGADRVHYCASKGAIGMLTKGMALELAPMCITVNAILPGSIRTAFNADVLSDDEFLMQCVKNIPAGRIGKPSDITGAVVMLASDSADYINGAFITIDGAQTV